MTAEKRETSLQDTAIAVSAFSNQELERGLINNNMDIQMAVGTTSDAGTLYGRNTTGGVINITGQYLQGASVGFFRTFQLLEPRTYGVTQGYSF